MAAFDPELADLARRAARAGRVAFFAEEEAIPTLVRLIGLLPDDTAGHAFMASANPMARVLAGPRGLHLRRVGRVGSSGLLHRLETLASPAAGGPGFVWFGGRHDNAVEAQAMLAAGARPVGLDFAVSICAHCPLRQAVLGLAAAPEQAAAPVPLPRRAPTAG
ncbi:hypothetical protein ORIO_21770 (plasmid) [Cereibacter azotoformans]|uniref:hypothetical protein n=1 Tax=Cereibacter azotoformans TaxID=43057 RepID=UPI001EECF09A|nr:hypothetical protein [Cereibacter azotoformans]ULB12416.1 hypothetical protein ORIO_21770 [Cereibacter azotoformans]